MTSTTSDNLDIARPGWLPREVWPYKIRTAHFDDKPVSYTDEGSGPALLLVHDGMWSYVWGQLIKELVDDFRVITLDFPGSGISPGAETEVSLQQDSRLLGRFVDHLGLDSFTLVVHDLGGSVGLGMAVQRPDAIDGLVLINTFAWPPDSKGLRRMLGILSSKPMTALNGATGLIPKLSSGSFGVGKHLDRPARQAFIHPLRQPSARRRFHGLMGSALTETGFLGKVAVGLEESLKSKSVLTIYGERNDPFGFQEKFREYFANTSEMVVAKGNHFPMCDDPVAVAEAIREWHRGVRVD